MKLGLDEMFAGLLQKRKGAEGKRGASKAANEDSKGASAFSNFFSPISLSSNESKSATFYGRGSAKLRPGVALPDGYASPVLLFKLRPPADNATKTECSLDAGKTIKTEPPKSATCCSLIDCFRCLFCFSCKCPTIGCACCACCDVESTKPPETEAGYTKEASYEMEEQMYAVPVCDIVDVHVSCSTEKYHEEVQHPDILETHNHKVHANGCAACFGCARDAQSYTVHKGAKDTTKTLQRDVIVTVKYIKYFYPDTVSSLKGLSQATRDEELRNKHCAIENIRCNLIATPEWDPTEFNAKMHEAEALIQAITAIKARLSHAEGKGPSPQQLQEILSASDVAVFGSAFAADEAMELQVVATADVVKKGDANGESDENGNENVGKVSGPKK